MDYVFLPLSKYTDYVHLKHSHSAPNMEVRLCPSLTVKNLERNSQVNNNEISNGIHKGMPNATHSL